MKKSILILVAAFTFSTFFTSCRETNTERNDVEVTDDLDDVGDEVEEAAEDVGSSVERAAEDVENEIERNDDLQ